MAAINSDRASLGLACDSGRTVPVLPTAQPAPATLHQRPSLAGPGVLDAPADGFAGPSGRDEEKQTLRQRRRSSAPLPPPIITGDGLQGRRGGAGSEQDNPLERGSHSLSTSPHRSIPPPSSPRRHRSGVIMARVRAHSGGRAAGFGASKSVGDLHAMGLSMTASSSPSLSVSKLDRGRSGNDAGQPIAPTPSGSMLLSSAPPAEEPTEDLWDGNTASLDNSARFYHRLHATSRTVSPTRSNASVSPSRHPSSGDNRGASPIFVRRNLTLPAGGGMPGATLSATLSPNSRFLQQHLPPLFPLTSPESDLENPHHPMVILTPTTQDWHELKELGRLEGEEVPSDESDSGSSSSRSPSPPQPPASIVVQDGASKPKKEFPQGTEEGSLSDPSTPVRPGFEPVIVGPSPIGWRQDDIGPGGEPVVEAVVDLDQPIGGLSMNDRPARPVRFNSIGRRDSLRVSERPSMPPRTKTKRELERERLFRMVDQEIAEDGTGQETRNSWSVHEIGSGLSTPPIGQTEFSAASTPKPETPRSDSPATPKLDAPAQVDSTEKTGKKSPPTFSPARPSPLHTEPLIGQGTSAMGLLGLGLNGGRVDSVGSIESVGSDEVSPPPEGRSSPPHDALPETQSERFEAIRNYSRSVSTRRSLGSRVNSRAPSRRGSYEEGNSSPPRSPRRRDTNRVSLVAGRVVQPFSFPGLSPLTSLNKDAKDSKASALSSFSPFRSSPAKANTLSLPTVPAIDGLKGNVSHAPSTGVPTPAGTPPGEKTGGVGGHGIDDYVILKEAGKGAYGLVMRAKVKGANGEPVGDEVIIKYVIKSRILADCWKKHKALGPIPVEIHVMDQLRHLIYHPPAKAHPWDPFRPHPGNGKAETGNGTNAGSHLPSPADSGPPSSDRSRADTPISPDTPASPAQRFIEVEIKHLPERGHPNICKLLDFFEDREFYYLVMPRYGTGVDLFDRVESEPAGLPAFEVRSLVGQLTDALRFLHANGIVHRDVKDENVILDGEGRCQLIDFGSAAHWRPGKKWDTFSGTLHYASPEIMRGEMYGGKEQDIWALGTVAYVLLVGETPFGELPDEVLEGLVTDSRALEALDHRCGGEFADEGREADGGGALGDAADFVRRCLEQDLKDRPTAEQLLQHRFLVGNNGWVGRRGWLKEKEKGKEGK